MNDEALEALREINAMPDDKAFGLLLMLDERAADLAEELGQLVTKWGKRDMPLPCIAGLAVAVGGFAIGDLVDLSRPGATLAVEELVKVLHKVIDSASAGGLANACKRGQHNG